MSQENKPEVRYKKSTWSTKLRKREAESGVVRRTDDCGVHCLENMEDPESSNPLDLEQGDFFVVSRSRIDAALGDHKSVTVGRLMREGHCSVSFGGLA